MTYTEVGFILKSGFKNIVFTPIFVLDLYQDSLKMVHT